MKRKVLAISGSTRKDSANLQIIKAIACLASDRFDVEVYDGLAALPHFNPDKDTDENVPEIVKKFRNKIKNADGVLICTPEYIFSLPGSLKNAIEWTVSTTVFSDKPVALITASASGAKAHESLLLIMETVQAKFTPELQLLISGARAKLNSQGEISDEITLQNITRLVSNFVNALVTI
jgi:NAD(P)H-dependent FMN reductase